MTTSNKAVIKQLNDLGYQHIRCIEGIGYCGIAGFIYTIGMCCNISPNVLDIPYEYRYCYQDFSEALYDLSVLEKDKLPEGNWIKRKSVYFQDLINENFIDHTSAS